MLNEDELRDALLLVFANKQDLPNAMNASEITDKLGLQGLRQRTWYIQVSSSHLGGMWSHPPHPTTRVLVDALTPAISHFGFLFRSAAPTILFINSLLMLCSFPFTSCRRRVRRAVTVFMRVLSG